MSMPDVDPYASVIIVAAGQGTRFGAAPKVLALAGGEPLLAWSLLAAANARTVREIVVVTGSHTDEQIRGLLGSLALKLPVDVVPGGDRRQDSVLAGVAAVSPDSETVLIHDGARPLVTPDMFDACAREARTSGAAILAIPVSDTLKDVDGETIRGTRSRNGLWAAQTPQAFSREGIREAIKKTRTMKREFTDEASLYEALGWPVRVVTGERSNIKVTCPEDIELVDALLRLRMRREQEAVT
jgi:2-C-methyl-D-erythritol 4-phosphate cytidylyltransferase